MRYVLSLAFAASVILAAPAVAAGGDVAKGKEAFKKCAQCHQVGPGAKTLIGPELNGVVGRKAVSVADFPYSEGMKKLGASGFVWTEENLDKWIANPKAMLPDSPMAALFPQGMPDAAERADVIAYLKTGPAQ